MHIMPVLSVLMKVLKYSIRMYVIKPKTIVVDGRNNKEFKLILANPNQTRASQNDNNI